MGEPARAIDRFIVTRGLLIAALDPLWMSWVFAPGGVLLQVLYVIGGSLVCMAALRRIGDGRRAGAAGRAALDGGAIRATPRRLSAPPLARDDDARGCCGRYLRTAAPHEAARLLAAAGLAALAVFAVVRGLNGYGNMRLARDDGSLVQWLHVSKYPPSLSFTALELGLMALCLSALLVRAQAVGPLVVLGQTALFYYLLHVHVLLLAARALGLWHAAGLGAAYGAALAVVLALYPPCRWYRGYKRARRAG